MQTAIDKDALPGGDVDSSHVKVMVKTARGTAGDCKGIKKYRFTVKGPASCRSAAAGGRERYALFEFTEFIYESTLRLARPS